MLVWKIYFGTALNVPLAPLFSSLIREATIIAMNADGSLTGTRPAWAWNIAHTDTRDNAKIWPSLERPIPISYSMPMTWHHVLGWDILKKTWSSLAFSARRNYTDAQAAATDSEKTPFFVESARLYEILKAWLQALDLTSRYNDGDTTFSDNKVDDIVQAFRTNSLDDNSGESLEKRMCWAQWNLVEGPDTTYRQDDPSKVGYFSNIDKFDRNMGRQFVDRYLSLKSMFGFMNAITQLNTPIAAASAVGFLKELKSLRKHKSAQIQMFDAKVWEVVPGHTGKFKFNKQDRITNVVEHPEWRKRG